MGELLLAIEIFWRKVIYKDSVEKESYNKPKD